MMRKGYPATEVGSGSIITPWMMLYLNSTSNLPAPYSDPSSKFQLVLFTKNIQDSGEYDFLVYIELADYPTATPAVAEFLVTVEPCIVTSLQPPGDLNVTYTVSPMAQLKTIRYSFAQSPCSYSGTYTANITEGYFNAYLPFPTFIKQFESEPTMTVLSQDMTHVGNYTIEVCNVLGDRSASSACFNIYLSM